MIEKMTRYDFILLSGDESRFLAQLQEAGLVDITRSTRPVDEQTAALKTRAGKLQDLLSALERLPIPGDIQPVPFEGDLATALPELLDKISTTQEELKASRKALSALKPWGTFSSETLRALEEAGCPLHFHVTPSKVFNPSWAETYPLEIIAVESGKTYYVVAAEKDTLPDLIPMPSGSAEETEARITALEDELSRLYARALGARERAGELQQDFTVLMSELDLRLAGAAAVPAAENTIVTLTGYAPSGEDAAVTATLDATGVFYLKDRATAADNPPISLRNNKFVRMFEVLTDMYGRPAYDGFDPTPFIAFFFLLFFAFCMGDCGYGLVLIVIGLLLRKVDSFKSLAPLVVTLGAGTAVIGFLFHTFFSIDISTWSVFSPIKGIFLPSKIAGYDGTMILALVVGVVHICFAMVVKTATETRNKGFFNALGTWGWTLLIVGGVAVGALSLAGVLDKAVTKIVIIVIGVLSALGIFVFNDLKRNKLANVGAGLWETYNTATGLLGDVLSYLRLYALGLAGSMLGMAFNDMGVMILGDSPNIGKWLGFLFLVIFGHTLNIAMCALGAFVHPLRLNFLEFFKNAGYEAAGRNYNPLKK